MSVFYVMVAVLVIGIIILTNAIVKKRRRYLNIQRRLAAGARGEDRVQEKIMAIMPKDALLFRNLYLPTTSGTTEIDLLLITRKKIFIFEVKNYRGRITGSYRKHDWKQYHHVYGCRYFYNPVWQNEGHIRAFLNLFPEISPAKVCSYVVFTGNCELAHIHVRRRIARVITDAALEKRFRRDSFFARRFLSYGELMTLKDALTPYSRS